MKGILQRRVNNSRVVVSLDSIGRAFAVEVDLESVRALENKLLVTDPPAMPPKFSAQPSENQPMDIRRVSSLRR